MNGKYRIGMHEFDSREEWENALSDLKKIKYIVEQKDIHKADEALRLYDLIREEKIVFKSEVGEAFFRDISDIVAENQKRLLEEEKKKRQQEIAKQKKEKKREKWRQKKLTMQQTIYRTAGIACILLACGCFVYFAFSQYSEAEKTRELELIKEKKSISQAVNWYFAKKEENQGTETLITENKEQSEYNEENSTQTQKKEVLPEYSTLYAQYPNLCGWLKIEGTQVDLPVMQTGDNEYYLHRNIDGAEDKNGSLFLDYRANSIEPSSNLIIYGHNMKNGSMFGSLKNYLETDFTEGHRTIQFDTIYEKQKYQLVAVCLSKVEYQDEGGFRYYNFIQAETEEQMQEFINYVRDCAIYSDVNAITKEDKLLTLSTCNSYVEDGRLFVVAKKIEDGE